MVKRITEAGIARAESVAPPEHVGEPAADPVEKIAMNIQIDKYCTVSWKPSFFSTAKNCGIQADQPIQVNRKKK